MPFKELVVYISGPGHFIKIFEQGSDMLSAMFWTSCRTVMKGSRGAKPGQWE